MTEQQKKWLKVLSFLDVRIDEDTISIMLSRQDSKKIYKLFKSEASARASKHEGYIVDEIIRRIMKLSVDLQSYKEFEVLTKRAEEARQFINKYSRFALSKILVSTLCFF